MGDCSASMLIMVAGCFLNTSYYCCWLVITMILVSMLLIFSFRRLSSEDCDGPLVEAFLTPKVRCWSESVSMEDSGW
jgi:hypothetical protein